MIAGCVSGKNSLALLEFVQRFHRLIASTVIKASLRFGGASIEVADDLIQETYVRLFQQKCRSLKEFKVRDAGGVYGFVQAVAYTTVQDHFRQELAQKRGGGVTVSLETAGETGDAAASVAACDRSVLLQEIDVLVRELASPASVERDHTIFWLYYRDGLTAKAIAQLTAFGLTVKGVESVIQRLTSDLRARVGISAERDLDPGKGVRR